MSVLIGFGVFNTRERAVPSVTSSEKFTCPFFTKLRTSGPAVTMEGNTGKIGFSHSSIFLCNTS